MAIGSPDVCLNKTDPNIFGYVGTIATAGENGNRIPPAIHTQIFQEEAVALTGLPGPFAFLWKVFFSFQNPWRGGVRFLSAIFATSF